MFKRLKTSFKPGVPIYVQIREEAARQIDDGLWDKNKPLPSINKAAQDVGAAKETVVKAYKELKAKGYITSLPGKGFYVSPEAPAKEAKVLALFNDMNPFKEKIFASFKEGLASGDKLDLYFYHDAADLFEELLESKRESYTHFVITPHSNAELSERLLKKIPENRLVLLDKSTRGLERYGSAVVQSFEADLLGALERLRPKINKYEHLVLLWPEAKNRPIEIKNAFESFIKKASIPGETTASHDFIKAQRNTAYLCLEDQDLIALVASLQKQGLRAGKDAGVISYNDEPLKEVLEGGITVISTDFEAMGKTAARLVKSKEIERINNPFKIIERKSV